MSAQSTQYTVKDFIDDTWSIFRTGDIITLDVNGDRVGYTHLGDQEERRGYAIGKNENDVLLPYFYCDWQGKKHNLIGEEYVNVTLSEKLY